MTEHSYPVDYNYSYGGPNIQTYDARHAYGPGPQTVYNPEVMPYHGYSTTPCLESPDRHPDRSTFISIREKYLKPETLDCYGLSWEYDKFKPDHIMVKRYIDLDFQAMLFAHTGGLKMRPKLEKSTKPRSRGKARSTGLVKARGYAPSQFSSSSSKRSQYASSNRGPSRSARGRRKHHSSTMGNIVPVYCSPYVETSEDVASTVRRGVSRGRVSPATSTEEIFSQVSLHSPTRSKQSQCAVSDRPLGEGEGEGEASSGHKDKYFLLRDKLQSLKRELKRIRNSRPDFSTKKLDQEIAEVRAARNKAERRMIVDREQCLGQRPDDNGEHIQESFGSSPDASARSTGAAENSRAVAARATHRDERQSYDIVITVVDAGPVLGLRVNKKLGKELRTLVRYQDEDGTAWHEKLKALPPKGETRRRRLQEAARVNVQRESLASLPTHCEIQLPRRSAQGQATPGNVQEPHSGMDHSPAGWRSSDRENQLRGRYAELMKRKGKSPLKLEGSGLLNATKPRRRGHVLKVNSVTDAATTKLDGKDKGKGKEKLFVYKHAVLSLPSALPEVQSVAQDDTEAIKGEGEDKRNGKVDAKPTSTPPANGDAASSIDSDGTSVLTPAASVDDAERTDADACRRV